MPLDSFEEDTLPSRQYSDFVEDAEAAAAAVRVATQPLQGCSCKLSRLAHRLAAQAATGRLLACLSATGHTVACSCMRHRPCCRLFMRAGSQLNLDPAGMLSPAMLGRQGKFMDAVVKVYCVHTEPNYSLPWQRKRQYASTSTGFMVTAREGSDRWLLTNAHSVEYHSQARDQELRMPAGAQCPAEATALTASSGYNATPL